MSGVYQGLTWIATAPKMQSVPRNDMKNKNDTMVTIFACAAPEICFLTLKQVQGDMSVQHDMDRKTSYFDF